MTHPVRVSSHARTSRLLAFCLAAVSALVGSPVQALTDEEVFRSMRWTAQQPGARSLGMGGAFIGLADDATATFSNPSGLAYITRPQAAVELRLVRPDAIEGSLAGAFDLAGVERFASGDVTVQDQDVASPSFLGYVHPINDYWVLAFSRHERMNVERETFTGYFSNAFPAFEDGPAGLPLEPLSTRGRMEMLVDTFSVSVASAPIAQLAFGATLSIARLDMQADVDNLTFEIVDANGNGQPDTFLRPIDYRTFVDDDDTQFTFTAGLLYRPHPKVGIGLVYRDGPEFDVIETLRQDGVRAKDVREYLVSRGIASLDGSFLQHVAIPDSYGIGVSFGPYFDGQGGGLTINADAVQVEYSDLLAQFVGGLNSQLFAADSTGVLFEVDDETEVHLGVGWSWVVGTNNMIHVRAGGYSEPDHALRGSGRVASVTDPSTGQPARVGAFFGDGDEEIHLTVGGGFTLKRGFYSFQLDGAADFSDFGEQYVGTALFRF